MTDTELKHCLFCGATGPNVCEGLTPQPGCAKPGLDAMIAAYSTSKAPEQASGTDEPEKTQD